MKKYFKITLAASSFIITFIVYYLTCAREVVFTDNGELASVCILLGIAHPTGYPLFTLLGYLWSLLPLPFSNIFQMNLLSAFYTSLSAAVFFFLISEIIELIDNRKPKPLKKGKKPVQGENEGSELYDIKLNCLVSLCGVLSYGFALTIWNQAVALEVYSLQLLMLNLILYVFLWQWKRQQQGNKGFVLAALLLGMSFSNHMSTILLLPSMLLLFFLPEKMDYDFSKGRLKLIFWLLLPFIAGLSFYIYLPLRSAGYPEFNWGWVFRGWDKFYYHISGKQLQVWMFSGENLGKNLREFFSLFPYQLGFIGILTFLYGLYAIFMASKKLFLFLALLIVCCVLYAINYSIHDIDSYFITAFSAILIFSGAGMYALVRINKNLLPLMFIIPLISLFLNFRENDNSDNYLVSEYTRILGENLKPDAVIISSQWDFWVSAFWYKQHIEGFRKDVVLLEKELLRRTWYPKQFERWYPEAAKLIEPEINSFMQELELFESGSPYDASLIQAKYINLLNSFINKNYGKRPIYLTLDILQSEQQVAADYNKIPEGFAFRLESKAQPPQHVSVDNINMDKFISSLKRNDDHLVKGIRESASVCLSNIGLFAQRNNQTDAAKNAFEKSLLVWNKNKYAVQGLQSLQKAEKDINK